MADAASIRAASPRASVMLDSMSNLLKYMPSNDIPSTYTIVVRGEEFKLSKAQIEFDSPNYFTSALLGDFRESASRTLHLDRNPHLFRIIVEYLTGYDVLPLSTSPSAIPPTMSPETAMRNLVADALFYGLTRLYDLLTLPSPLELDLEGLGFSGRRIVRLDDVIGENLPEGIEYIDGGLFADSNGMHQPALVYAQNLPLRIVGNAEVDRTTRLKTATLHYYIDYAPQVVSEGVKHPPTIIADTHADCTLHINAHRASFSSPISESAFSSFSGPISTVVEYWKRGLQTPSDAARPLIRALDSAYPRKQQGGVAADVRHEEISLWADELLFTVVRRGNDAGDPVLYIRLCNVKARTRAAILDGFSAPKLR